MQLQPIKNSKDELRVNIKLKSNRLISARERLGLTISQMARKMAGDDINNFKKWRQYIGELENLKRDPFYVDKTIREYAKDIIDFLGLTQEEAFPIKLNNIKNTKVEFTAPAEKLGGFFLSSPQNNSLIANKQNPETILMLKESGNITQTIEENLKTLSPRIEHILRLRFFEDKTLEEIAEEIGRSKQRVRDLIQKGLRMLRHPGYVSGNEYKRRNLKEFENYAPEA